MELSRRRLLAGLLTAAGAALAGGSGAFVFRHRLHAGARGLFHHLTDPPLPPSPPGELDSATAAVLAAVAEGLVGEAGRHDRYLSPFHWRAAHLPGHREVYRRFAAFAETAAPGFAVLPATARRRLLAGWFPGGRWRHLVTGWASPQRMLLRRHVVGLVLEVYAATDAWADLGYGAWPGVAQGLDSYRGRPPGAARR
jgi:hypothetical protein